MPDALENQKRYDFLLLVGPDTRQVWKLNGTGIYDRFQKESAKILHPRMKDKDTGEWRTVDRAHEFRVFQVMQAPEAAMYRLPVSEILQHFQFLELKVQ